MTLMEHLGELRTRLFVAILSIAVGTVIGWFLYTPVFNFLTNPFCGFIMQHRTLAIDPANPCKVAFTSAVDPFMLKIKLATYIGFCIALPVTLFELWRFITPGLTSRERRYAIPFVLSSLLLFILGAAFAMFTLPKALSFLLGFAGTERFTLVLTATTYLSFVMLIIAVFGLSFEFPVVLVALVAANVLSSARLRKWRRYAILGIAIFAAVITPSQDWFTMSAMMVPLILFYELAILIARFIMKK